MAWFCLLHSGNLCNVSLVSATMVLGKLLCADVLFDIGFITCLVTVTSAPYGSASSLTNLTTAMDSCPYTF